MCLLSDELSEKQIFPYKVMLSIVKEDYQLPVNSLYVYPWTKQLVRDPVV